MPSMNGPVLSPLKVAALVFLLAGGLSLAYGGFSFTEARHTAKVGDVAVSLDERRTVDLPKWFGISALVVGAVLLVLPTRRQLL